jgi:hypothetical protein
MEIKHSPILSPRRVYLQFGRAAAPVEPNTVSGHTSVSAGAQRQVAEVNPTPPVIHVGRASE